MEKEKQAKQELELLLNRGVTLTLSYKELEPRKPWRFWRKRQLVDKSITLTFKEPTLAVLDRVSLEIENLQFNEKRLLSADMEVVIDEGKRIAYGSARTLARIAAIFALGEKLFIKRDRTFFEDEKELDRLAEIIMNSLEPSKLEKLISCLTSLSNIASFINSIRLIAAVRTTQNLVE